MIIKNNNFKGVFMEEDISNVLGKFQDILKYIMKDLMDRFMHIKLHVICVESCCQIGMLMVRLKQSKSGWTRLESLSSIT